ncbi:SDR family NAD(P)-dependent oxidoreductase [Oceanibacterium hippocampi]|uniref:3-oxoacyl-[acyl-carrier-protein] reductase FabG n=1 Tax=Oceanibacterium hippocampi TaxID=745714 RepID=A0A1Y5TWP4_9PROT|nr:SDR family NAD(P)-dependent oxidoreductase [Oceanibacterium hippocampi]SLN71795.1 3-oxoacyl-[acyl-carrier-protein] reductase FabG [Oceanibacterium hippocampi]
MRLAGRVALVTGAGGPMGEAVATRFAEEGASLVLTDISGRRLEAAAERIRAALQSGADIVSRRADVRDAVEARALVDAGHERFPTIDVLINVVGGIRSQTLYMPILEMPEERLDETLALNLKGAFHLVRLVAPDMLRSGYGRIVNFSSINMAGEAGQADYGAAKAAVASLTRSLAMELAPQVNVNCVAPATIRTSVMANMPPEETEKYRSRTVLKRLGEPREVANTVLFLASEEASYVTGEMIAVSGGIWPAL